MGVTVRRRPDEKQETSEEVTAGVRARDAGGTDQSSNSRGGKKWPESGHILNMAFFFSIWG